MDIFRYLRLETKGKQAMMGSRNDYTTRFTVDQDPTEVFKAINNVRGWWSGEVEGVTDQPGAEFTYSVPGIHWSKQKVTEFDPGKRIVWRIVDSRLDFTKAKNEWNGTDIVFAISRKDGKTEVSFAHSGLVPSFECFGNCSSAWDALVNGNLRKFIATGEVQPSPW
jgi:hypothetical protein